MTSGRNLTHLAPDGTTPGGWAPPHGLTRCNDKSAQPDGALLAGHFLLIKAFEAAEASAIQPFAYLQHVFSSMVGVIVFSEIISPWTIAGGAVVFGAGVFAFWRERVRARQAKAEAERLREAA